MVRVFEVVVVEWQALLPAEKEVLVGVVIVVSRECALILAILYPTVSGLTLAIRGLEALILFGQVPPVVSIQFLRDR